MYDSVFIFNYVMSSMNISIIMDMLYIDIVLRSIDPFRIFLSLSSNDPGFMSIRVLKEILS